MRLEGGSSLFRGREFSMSYHRVDISNWVIPIEMYDKNFIDVV